MACYDVYHVDAGDISYVVDVQSDSLSRIKTRVVIPLAPASEGYQNEIHPRLRPVLLLKGTSFVLLTTEIATVTLDFLGPVAGSVQSDHAKITAALDFLFHGY